MIRICEFEEAKKTGLLKRGTAGGKPVADAVRSILQQVREGGDTALYALEERFDGVRLSSLLVSEAELDAAESALSDGLRASLQLAAANIRAFHEKQVPCDFRMDIADGVFLGQKYTPIERVGLYVPGGTASYPSTVLMNAIPAKLAGCPEIVMTTPPAKDGSVAPAILAAARLAGVDKIYKLGGAQAVAALAYGTESVAPVAKIVGPGNAYVAEAKRQVYGLVGIDMIAGPSEILVVADAGSNPANVAADLLSQAEHDRLATAVLVTDDKALAKAVAAEIERQLPLLSRADIARASMEANGCIYLTDDLPAAIAAANELAPEHMELAVADAERYLDLVTNAGSVFLGYYCPEPLGDYLAGPNHTLPTMGTARFSGALSVDDFRKKTQYLSYTKEALRAVRAPLVTLATTEGLTAHANAADIRFAEDDDE